MPKRASKIRKALTISTIINKTIPDKVNVKYLEDSFNNYRKYYTKHILVNNLNRYLYFS